MNSRILKIAALFLVLAVAVIAFLNFSTTKKKGEAVIFSMDIAEDATPKVLERIMSADENPIASIQFEKGTYHFYPDKAFETYCQISNHDDVLTRTAFPLFKFKNLVIDGQGSKFIFHGKMIPFIIDDCKNIEVKNLSVDWAQTFHSEGLVVANDEKNNSFDLQISEEYPYEIRDNRLIFIKEYYEHTLVGQSILYDPERKAIAFNTEAYTPIGASKKTKAQYNIDQIQYKYKVDTRTPSMKQMGRENKMRVEQVKSGLVRIFNNKKKLPPVGNILVSKGIKGYKGGNRQAPAFRVIRTVDFNAKNVTVHHAGGMGLIAENSENLILDGFNVTPSNGRMVSTTADATHFVGCRGKVVLKNCTFNNQLDDATNVHGSYQEIIDILDEHRLGIRMGHFQQEGFTLGRPNDKLGIIRLDDSFFPYGNLTIKSIEVINGRYQILTVKETLPKKLKAGDLLENLDNYPDVLVENCNISRNRARGLLVSTPKSMVIKNNFFSTEMEALLIPVESGFWYESGNAATVTITGNTFQDCQHSGFNRGVIRFATDDDNENIAFKNIEISNNKFNHFDNLIVQITNTDGLSFTGNTITNSGTFPQLYPENPAFTVKASKNIIFNNNTYKGKAEVMLDKDKSVESLEFK